MVCLRASRSRLSTTALAGTGFVGVTDKRLILQDKSFVGKNVAITSIPFKQIRTVSMVSNKSWAGGFFSSSSVAIDVGGTSHIAEFRGQDKARHIHNLILWTSSTTDRCALRRSPSPVSGRYGCLLPIHL